MIDWLTLRLRRDRLFPVDLEMIERSFKRVVCIDPDGEMLWQTLKRESLRSDTHRLTVYLGQDFEIAGSPARLGKTNNVFGSGDINYCASTMIETVNTSLGFNLPNDIRLWRCTRVDVTHNFDMGGPVEVKQALSYLRHSESGRHQVRTKEESVYWSPNSKLRAGKAYHKGPHLRYQMLKGSGSATSEELLLADRLLRLELVLRSQFWRERCIKPWFDFTESELDVIHFEFFTYVAGNIEVEQVDDMLEKFCEVAPTPGYAHSAYRTWCLIKSIGVREAESSMRRSTWHKHKRIMLDAGLTWADLHAQKIERPKRKLDLSKPIRSWEELRCAAALEEASHENA